MCNVLALFGAREGWLLLVEDGCRAEVQCSVPVPTRIEEARCRSAVCICIGECHMCVPLCVHGCRLPTGSYFMHERGGSSH